MAQQGFAIRSWTTSRTFGRQSRKHAVKLLEPIYWSLSRIVKSKGSWILFNQARLFKMLIMWWTTCKPFSYSISGQLPIQDNTFYVSAFGNSNDDFSFTLSKKLISSDNFPSLRLIKNYTDFNFCLKATLNSSSSSLTLRPIQCKEKLVVVCQKRITQEIRNFKIETLKYKIMS